MAKNQNIYLDTHLLVWLYEGDLNKVCKEALGNVPEVLLSSIIG